MQRKSVTLLALLMAVIATAARGADPNPKVVCDSKAGTLTVAANQVSLTALMNEIAARCAVEIKVDPDAESLVSARFNEQTIEDGLRVISDEATQNYVFFYSSAKGLNGQRKVSSLSLYTNGRPAGARTAQPSTPPPAATPSYQPPATAAATPAPATVISGNPEDAKAQASPANNEDQNVKARIDARERLEKRLATLPAEQRQRVLKLEEDRQRRRDQRDAARQKMLEERQKYMQQNPEGAMPPQFGK